MKSLLQFLSYHNAVPIVFGILFLGATGAAAASPEVRDAVLDSVQEVRSVDNSRILSADVATLPLSVTINEVTEDNEFYYVGYTIQTIEIIDYVWQDIEKEMELQVSKEFLSGQDLGVYASKQIAEVRDAERVRLRETQTYEKEIGASRKVVATVYSGLIGQFVEPVEKIVPEYVNIEPAHSPTQAPVANGNIITNNTQAPRIQILGKNPARISLRTTYADLGALVTDDVDDNLGIHVFLGDKEVKSITLDTSKEATYKITYRATDSSGNVGQAVRTVIVGNATSTPSQSEDKKEDVPVKNSASSTPIITGGSASSTGTVGSKVAPSIPEETSTSSAPVIPEKGIEGIVSTSTLPSEEVLEEENSAVDSVLSTTTPENI